MKRDGVKRDIWTHTHNLSHTPSGPSIVVEAMRDPEKSTYIW